MLSIPLSRAAARLHARAVLFAAVLATIAFAASADASLAGCESALTGSTATVTCDAANDTVTVTQAAGFLLLNGSFDWDTAALGIQFLPAANTSTIGINTGGGNDAVNVGDGGNAASLILAIITVTNTGADGDTLTIDDSISASSSTYTINAGTVTGGGINVTAAGTGLNGGVTVKAGSAADIVDVQSPRAFGTVGAEPIIIVPTNGDTVNVGDAGNSLDPFQQQTVQVNGAAATTAIVNINDQGDTGPNTYTYTSTQVTRGTGPSLVTISYTNIQPPNLNTSGGSDLIRLRSVIAGVIPTINSGGGDDSTFVSSTSADLSGFANSFNVVGGPGSDKLEFDDDNHPGPDTYTLNSGNITRIGFPGTTYDNSIEVVVLRTSLSGGIINVISTANETNIGGGNGNETLVFADGATLSGGAFVGLNGINSLDYSAYTTPVVVDLAAGTATGTSGATNVINVTGGSANDTVTGVGGLNLINGGPGIDTVIANGNAVSGDAFTLGPHPGFAGRMLLDRTNVGPYTLDLGSTEVLILNGGGGADSLKVAGTLPGFTVNFNGGGEDDTLNLVSDAAAPLNSVKAIQGPIIFDGGAGANTINITDSGALTSTTATVSSTQVGAGAGNNLFGAGGSLNYQNASALNLTLGSGDDNLSVIPSATTAYNLVGGPHGLGDKIDINVAGVTGASLTGNASNGQLTSTNRQVVTFSQFETLLTNTLAANGTFSFSAPTYTVTENGVNATITVNRTDGALGTVSVNAITTDGTAVAPADYTSIIAALAFAENEATRTFNVAIVNDTLVEGAETINLRLDNPQGGATLGVQRTAVLTIQDDDGGAVAPAPGAPQQDPSQAQLNQDKQDSDDDDARRARKNETKEQQQQREHTNNANLEEYESNGQVMGIRLSLNDPIPNVPAGEFIPEPNAVPYILIYNADGVQQIKLSGEAAQKASQVRIGDEIRAEGSKRSEELFEATDLDVPKR